MADDNKKPTILDKFKSLFSRKKSEDSESKKMSKLKVCVLCVLVLLVVGLALNCFKSIGTGKLKSSPTSESVSAKSYIENLESRLSSLVSGVSGVSCARVFVSVDSSPKIIYATDEQKTENGGNIVSSSSITFIKDGTQTQPVVVMTQYPEIKGVLIVAKGVGDPRIKLSLSDALSAVLHIPASNIHILEGR